MSVRRYDRGELLQAVRTPEGYLLVEGRLAKVGVLSYRLADGSTQREFVPPETLFDPAWLASIGWKPVTDEHPPVFVDPDNVAQYGVGNVGSEIVADQLGGFVRIQLIVRTREGIEAAESRAPELSPGYEVDLDPTPGIYTDSAGVAHPYDAIQRNRRCNHVALTRAARGGHDIRINLDSGDAQQIGGGPAAEGTMADEQVEKQTIEIAGVRHDGVDPALAAGVAQLLAQLTSSKEESDGLRSQLGTMQADAAMGAATLAELQGKYDACMAQLDAARKDLADKEALLAQLQAGAAAKTDSELGPDFTARFNERVELLAVAGFVAVDKADTLDNGALRKAIVAKHAPTLKLDGLADGYLKGYVDRLACDLKVSDQARESAALALAGFRKDGGRQVTASNFETTMDAARDAYEKRFSPATKKTEEGR
jgi:hypothetical protein